MDVPVLSARRSVTRTGRFEPVMRDFLRTPIRLEPHTQEVRETVSARPTKTRRRPDGSIRTTHDDIIAGQRRAFELRHQRQVKMAKKSAENDWRAKEKFRDWQTKATAKKLESKRQEKDMHVLEDVIHERNEYYLRTIGATEVAERRTISHARALPPEMMHSNFKGKRPWA